MYIRKNIEKITTELNNKIINVEKNHFEDFNETLNYLTKNLNKLEYMENNKKQIIVDKLFLLNQELFELQSKFDDLNYQILRDNIENLTEKQKKELQEYVELEKMKKKYYGYLAITLAFTKIVVSLVIFQFPP